MPVYDTAPLSPFPAHHRHFQTYAIPIQGMGEVPVDEGLEHQTQARGDSYFCRMFFPFLLFEKMVLETGLVCRLDKYPPDTQRNFDILFIY